MLDSANAWLSCESAHKLNVDAHPRRLRDEMSTLKCLFSSSSTGYGWYF